MASSSRRPAAKRSSSGSDRPPAPNQEAAAPDPDLVEGPPKSEQAGNGNLPPPLFGVLVVAGLVVIGVGLQQTASIIGPLFLVITIVIAVIPLRTLLVNRGVPQLLASILTMLAVYGLILVILGSVVWSLTRLATTLPDYSDQFTELYQQGIGVLAGFGVSTEVLQNAANQLNPSSFAGIAQTALSTVGSGLAAGVLIATLVFFIVFDAAGFADRIATIRQFRPRIADGLVDFAQGTRQYWIVTTVFGFIVAALDVVGLLIIGVPLAFTWGVLAFVTNYIPNVGFVIGIIPPALIALLAAGPPQAIAVIVVYVVINIVVQTLIQPRFTGDAVGISPTVAFLSLIFWAYLLGVLGALLAVPATKFVKSLLIDHSTSGQWFGAFLNASTRRRGQPPMDGVRGRRESKA